MLARSQIKVRLRKSANGGFYHYEHILGTLLHELCHNRHGAHSVDFYKLLDEITAECEQLMAQKITGDGKGGQIGGAFGGRSSGALGGTRSGKAPSRADAARAAEARARAQKIMTKGGQKLGCAGAGGRGAAGPSETKPADARAAAAAAAQKRCSDNAWCPAERCARLLHAVCRE